MSEHESNAVATHNHRVKWRGDDAALWVAQYAERDDLVTRAEAAIWLRTSERTVVRLAASGLLTEVRVSQGVPRITVTSVREHLKRIGAIPDSTVA